jgi:hypothetical protein
MGSSMARNTLAEVEAKYAHLEEYLRDYIDSLAYNANRDLLHSRYLRQGVLLMREDMYNGFPSYNHWRFTYRHKLYQHQGIELPSFFF